MFFTTSISNNNPQQSTNSNPVKGDQPLFAQREVSLGSDINLQNLHQNQPPQSQSFISSQFNSIEELRATDIHAQKIINIDELPHNTTGTLLYTPSVSKVSTNIAKTALQVMEGPEKPSDLMLTENSKYRIKRKSTQSNITTPSTSKKIRKDNNYKESVIKSFNDNNMSITTTLKTLGRKEKIKFTESFDEAAKQFARQFDRFNFLKNIKNNKIIFPKQLTSEYTIDELINHALEIHSIKSSNKETQTYLEKLEKNTKYILNRYIDQVVKFNFKEKIAEEIKKLNINIPYTQKQLEKAVKNASVARNKRNWRKGRHEELKHQASNLNPEILETIEKNSKIKSTTKGRRDYIKNVLFEKLKDEKKLLNDEAKFSDNVIVSIIINRHSRSNIQVGSEEKKNEIKQAIKRFKKDLQNCHMNNLRYKTRMSREKNIKAAINTINTTSKKQDTSDLKNGSSPDRNNLRLSDHEKLGKNAAESKKTGITY